MYFNRLKTRPFVLILLAGALALPGCGGGGSSGGNPPRSADQPNTGEPSTPAEPSDGAVTLDASDDSSARINLNDGSTVTTGDDWHVSYQKYVGFFLQENAKACVAHQYDALYDDNGEPVVAEFGKLTAANTLEDFNAVSTTSCEPVADTLKILIPGSGWYNYSGPFGPPLTIADDGRNGWIVRGADGNSYARFRFSSFAPMSVMLSMEVEAWDAAAQQFLPATDSGDIAFKSAPVYWDLQNNIAVTEDDAWDLKFSYANRNISIQVNGGASGSGKGGVTGADGDGNPQGVGALQSATVWDVTDPTDTTQVYKYFADGATGALSGPSAYGALEYGLNNNHDMTPNFATYLVEKDGLYFAMQVLSNYGETGTDPSGTLRIRYRALQ